MEWLAPYFVLFELCVLSADATEWIDDQKSRPVWVQPSMVAMFTPPRVREPGAVEGCMAIQVDGYRFYVVGSPKEILAKLGSDPDRLHAPGTPAGLSQ